MVTPHILPDGTLPATLLTEAAHVASALTMAREALSKTAPRSKDYKTSTDLRQAIREWHAEDQALRLLEERAHAHLENVRRAIEAAGGVRGIRQILGRQGSEVAHAAQA